MSIFECLNGTDYGPVAKQDFNESWNLSTTKSSKENGREGLAWSFPP